MQKMNGEKMYSISNGVISASCLCTCACAVEPSGMFTNVGMHTVPIFIGGFMVIDTSVKLLRLWYKENHR